MRSAATAATFCSSTEPRTKPSRSKSLRLGLAAQEPDQILGAGAAAGEAAVRLKPFDHVVENLGRKIRAPEIELGGEIAKHRRFQRHPFGLRGRRARLLQTPAEFPLPLLTHLPAFVLERLGFGVAQRQIGPEKHWQHRRVDQVRAVDAGVRLEGVGEGARRGEVVGRHPLGVKAAKLLQVRPQHRIVEHGRALCVGKRDVLGRLGRAIALTLRGDIAAAGAVPPFRVLQDRVVQR